LPLGVLRGFGDLLFRFDIGGLGRATAIILGLIGGIIIGFIAGAIVTFIYNVVLGLIGGIEMDLEIKE
jgi:hypothetical protein